MRNEEHNGSQLVILAQYSATNILDRDAFAHVETANSSPSSSPDIGGGTGGALGHRAPG